MVVGAGVNLLHRSSSTPSRIIVPHALLASQIHLAAAVRGSLQGSAFGAPYESATAIVLPTGRSFSARQKKLGYWDPQVDAVLLQRFRAVQRQVNAAKTPLFAAVSEVKQTKAALVKVESDGTSQILSPALGNFLPAYRRFVDATRDLLAAELRYQGETSFLAGTAASVVGAYVQARAAFAPGTTYSQFTSESNQIVQPKLKALSREAVVHDHLASALASAVATWKTGERAMTALAASDGGVSKLVQRLCQARPAGFFSLEWLTGLRLPKAYAAAYAAQLNAVQQHGCSA